MICHLDRGRPVWLADDLDLLCWCLACGNKSLNRYLFIFGLAFGRIRTEALG